MVACPEEIPFLLRVFRFQSRWGTCGFFRAHGTSPHTGLVRLSRRSLCAGIDVEVVTQFCNAQAARWTFKATIFKSRTCKWFVGYGDANPSNVSPLLHGAEMRVAETRAVNRALRKAYGIGICSVEEIGSFAEPAPSSRESKKGLPQQLLQVRAVGIAFHRGCRLLQLVRRNVP